MGFQVKFGKNIYKNTYKYTASIEERVDDFMLDINGAGLFFTKSDMSVHINR